MARTKEAGGRQQRGGRSPGHWELVQPDELRRFREEQRLSRAKLANLVGVSATSVQNWESGRVASLKIQRRLRA